MGLDMYAFAVPATDVGEQQVDVNLNEVNGAARVERPEELFYWRKHHDLHGWMAALYQSKGGADTDFNCNTVRLMPEDLDALEEAIAARTLPSTVGFFFGEYPPDNETDARDREFIAKARAAIADGKAVLYDSWW